jgi:ascorbate-specific PTS system EIIC-type component UlaA
MKLIQSLLAKVTQTKHKLVQHQQRLATWIAIASIGLFSGQANAAGKIAQMICTFKNQFFDNALIGAVFVFAGIALAIYKMMDDDDKIKSKLLGLFAMLALISALPEIAVQLGFASC